MAFLINYSKRTVLKAFIELYFYIILNFNNYFLYKYNINLNSSLIYYLKKID